MVLGDFLEDFSKTFILDDYSIDVNFVGFDISI